MLSRYPTLPKLLAVAFLTICVAWPFSAPVEAKGKKGKSVSRSRKQVSSSRSRSARRYSARRKGRRSRNLAQYDVVTVPVSYPIAPDRIEVIESGSESSPDLKPYLNPPLPRAQTSQDSSIPVAITPTRRRPVNIDPSRAMQIQQALNQRGFYFGEITGVYDAETIEAMRRFQSSQKISATGYPTAHALKRLGLASW
jgi:hypothetical protein